LRKLSISTLYVLNVVNPQRPKDWCFYASPPDQSCYWHCLSIHPVWYCYHDISWTAPTVSI